MSSDSVAVVMGGSGGLGSALVARFAADGWRVVAAGRNRGLVEAVADRARRAGASCDACEADVLNEASVADCVDGAAKRWGRVDVLVNATGGSLAQLTGGPDRDVTDLSSDEFDLVVDVNLKGSFHCVKAAGRQMIRQGGGHIILIASGSGLRPGNMSAAYAASKAGLFGLMKGAAKDLGAHNVRVNAVNPGLIPHERMPDGAAARFVDAYRAETMLGRLSTPTEFARLVAMLATADAISGQIINLDSRVFF
jgi:3-oxoacyl-[acyl-carrier protein] reductase